MSARVGVENADGTVTSVNVQYHGHLSGTGRCLFHHHNSEASARGIVSLGDLFSLRKRLEPTAEEAAGVLSSATLLSGDVTIALRRDLGETEEVEAVTHGGAFTTEWPKSGQEYLYLWRDGAWHWTVPGIEFRPLTENAVATR